MAVGGRTGLALEQVLRLVRCDVRDGGEDVRAVRCGTLDAVSKEM